jgi:hypothetical protein
MTCSKTVLYFLLSSELCYGDEFIVQTTWPEYLLCYIIPNGTWIVMPLFCIISLVRKIMYAIEISTTKQMKIKWPFSSDTMQEYSTLSSSFVIKFFTIIFVLKQICIYISLILKCWPCIARQKLQCLQKRFCCSMIFKTNYALTFLGKLYNKFVWQKKIKNLEATM